MTKATKHLCDHEIRDHLYSKEDNFKCFEDNIVIEELELCQGAARIDLAVINGNIHGYEIKSELDTLIRLPAQISVYNKVMDTITLILCKDHLHEAERIIPPWWGIKLINNRNDKIEIDIIRDNIINPQVDAFSLVQLLWKEEIVNFFNINGVEKGIISKPKYILWEMLANDFQLAALKEYVRTTLKSRKNWRAAQQRS
jgi:hypothetical protein